MAFEVYDKIGQSQGLYNASGVRLSRDGIHFTQKFAKENSLSIYSYIIFYYDKDSKRIGFSFQNTFIKGQTYKLTKIGSRATGYKCGANSFLRHYDIVPTESIRYEPTYDEENMIFVIELKEKR